jgi:hypothetical protein
MTAFRRVVRVTVAAAAAAMVAACAPMKVFWFPERGVDFSAYRTYAWAPAVPVAVGDARLDNNPFFHDYVRRAVDRELAARGIERVESAPDMLLHYHASVDQTIDLRGVDRFSAAAGDPMPEAYDAGTIVIDLLDARTTRLIWRGWAQSSFDGVVDNQERLEARIDAAVARVLAKLPHGE